MPATADAKRVFKLALGADGTKKQRYVVETRSAGGGRLGVILIGLKSPDRVLVSSSAARAALNAEEFVCVDANVERELVNARAIRVVRVERGERVCVLDDGEATNANVGAPANRGETSTEGSPSGPSPAKMMGATNQDVLGMLSGIMKGASPRILRKDEAGGIIQSEPPAPTRAAGQPTGQPTRTKSPMLTPRTTRGGTATRGPTSTNGQTPPMGSASGPGASSLPLGTFGAASPSFFSPAFASPSEAAPARASGDDYIESMMSDFSAALLGGDTGDARVGANIPLGYTSPSVNSHQQLEHNVPSAGDRELSPFFSSVDASASGVLGGALEDGVDVAPHEDISGLRGGDADEIDLAELTAGRFEADALGLDATPAELTDLLNRSRILRQATETLGDSALDDDSIKEEVSAPPTNSVFRDLQREPSAGEICTAFNLRGDKFGCNGCVSRHVCQLCESPRHTFGMCPSLYANIHKRVENKVCLDYYLNSVDDTGGALRNGWDQEKHVWNLCPRSDKCMLEHVCGACGKSGNDAHLPTCRLHAVFADSAPVDLCRKYYLHSLGDYFKMESDSQKFKIGSSGGWALCGKGDRCHSRHICGHCGEEGRGKHKPECKLHSVCGVIPDANKQPCFLYFMKSMVGIREFEKALLGGSAKGFCSQKKGECSGYHVCGSCGKEDVSPYNAEGHAASCRMRTISNEIDPTLNPRTKQMLKDYEEELARVRASAKSKETTATQTNGDDGSKAESKSDQVDDDALTPIDVKRCRRLRSEIDAILRGIGDDIDLLVEEAVECAGKEMKKSANPTHKLEQIRENFRKMM